MEWPTALAGQLEVRRKDEVSARGVLYAAVVQNSRKWKMARAVRKKGRRQSGEVVKRRMARVDIRPTARPMPRQKERVAMPARDFGWWGR
jgi:hypothetical protein